MYSDFIKNLPLKPKAFENFLIKGLKVPICDLNSPLAQAIGNYFLKKENIFVFTSPFQGKLESIEEVTTKLLVSFAIITDKNYFKQVKETVTGPVYLNTDFKNPNDFEHLIFYNVEIPSNINGVHISGFYTFKALYDPSLYKTFISQKLENLPNNFIYTTICKYPNKKKVEFVFGTAENIKHLAFPLNKNQVIYHQKPLAPAPEKYFKDSNLIREVPEVIPFEKFIFYDLNPQILPSVLDQVDSIVIVYTKSDFGILQEVVTILQDKKLEVPEPIIKITKEAL